jgi:hypothetical protein
MSVSEAIYRRSYDIPRRRPAADTITDGYAIPGAPTSDTIFGTVQPLSGKELRNLPPGQNALDWRNVWSLDELFLRDQLTIEGVTYVVQQVDPWQIDGQYWKAQACRVADRLT